MCPLDCRSDRAVHTSACYEASCGAATAVGVPRVWHLPGWLSVHGRDLQGNACHTAMTNNVKNSVTVLWSGSVFQQLWAGFFFSNFD